MKVAGAPSVIGRWARGDARNRRGRNVVVIDGDRGGVRGAHRVADARVELGSDAAVGFIRRIIHGWDGQRAESLLRQQ